MRKLFSFRIFLLVAERGRSNFLYFFVNNRCMVIYFFVYFLRAVLEVALNAICSVLEFTDSFTKRFCHIRNAFSSEKKKQNKQDKKDLTAAKIQKKQYCSVHQKFLFFMNFLSV